MNEHERAYAKYIQELRRATGRGTTNNRPKRRPRPVDNGPWYMRARSMHKEVRGVQSDLLRVAGNRNPEDFYQGSPFVLCLVKLKTLQEWVTMVKIEQSIGITWADGSRAVHLDYFGKPKSRYIAIFSDHTLSYGNIKSEEAISFDQYLQRRMRKHTRDIANVLASNGRKKKSIYHHRTIF